MFCLFCVSVASVLCLSRVSSCSLLGFSSAFSVFVLVTFLPLLLACFGFLPTFVSVPRLRSPSSSRFLSLFLIQARSLVLCSLSFHASLVLFSFSFLSDSVRFGLARFSLHLCFVPFCDSAFCVGVWGAVAAAGDHFSIWRWRPLSCAVASGRHLRRSGGGSRRAPSLAQVREVSTAFCVPRIQDSSDFSHMFAHRSLV